ncbi:MAG: RluA family pseudouridine synthase [Acidimicrobiales bacterium]
MTERFTAEVPRALDAVRVDRAIAMLTGVSRARAAALVSSGKVTLEGREIRSRSTPLVAGQMLVVEVPEPPVLEPEEGVPFRVVYDDSSLVVVDKPAGVVVHPGAGRPAGTLVAGLLARYPDLAGLAGECDPVRPGVVHRLDRGTSGLLVVARTVDAYRSLAAQMAARSAGREYLALVAGHLDDDRGTIDAPIGRSARTPTRMAVSAAGRPARTGYEVRRRLDAVTGRRGTMELSATLVACRLETGRTHQIRVHFAAIDHPVVGDDRYGRPPPGVLEAGRLFLHAGKLSVDHPVTGERMTWTSALPEDLSTALDGAGAPQGGRGSGGGVVGAGEGAVD